MDLETSEEELCAFLDRRGQIFKRVMPLAMWNIAIAQQRDIERYRRVRGGVLGQLPIGTSASLVSTPNPHLCASSECY